MGITFGLSLGVSWVLCSPSAGDRSLCDSYSCQRCTETSLSFWGDFSEAVLSHKFIDSLPSESQATQAIWVIRKSLLSVGASGGRLMQK